MKGASRHFTVIASLSIFFLLFSHEDALSYDHCNDGECLNFVARLSFANEERPLHSVASVKVRSRILYSLRSKTSLEFSANPLEPEIFDSKFRINEFIKILY